MANPIDLQADQAGTYTEQFPPSKEEALSRLAKFVDHAAYDYRSKRNFDLGAGHHDNVSQLSPYIRSGLLSEMEITSKVLAIHSFKEAEKFLQEVYWRVYWKGYLNNRPYIWTDYKRDLVSLQLTTSEDSNYHAAIQATTGIACFDTWSRELLETGYLHNHARMWFASIWIFTLQLPWQLGADFFMRHLMDGDPASNTLSWRWVAGLHTKGKAYLARPDNIARYTSGRFQDITGPATQALPKCDPNPHSPAAFTKLPSPPPNLTASQGLLIADEDLREHITKLHSNTPVLGIYNESLYKQENTAPKVAAFCKACLRETLEQLRGRYGSKTELTNDPSAANILTWARHNKVDSLFLAEPRVGPWRDLWRTTSAKLEDNGITVSYFRPWWENELFPHATHGFFKFKIHIERIAMQLQQTKEASSHGA